MAVHVLTQAHAWALKSGLLECRVTVVSLGPAAQIDAGLEDAQRLIAGLPGWQMGIHSADFKRAAPGCASAIAVKSQEG